MPTTVGRALPTSLLAVACKCRILSVLFVRFWRWETIGVRKDANRPSVGRFAGGSPSQQAGAGARPLFPWLQINQPDTTASACFCFQARTDGVDGISPVSDMFFKGELKIGPGSPGSRAREGSPNSQSPWCLRDMCQSPSRGRTTAVCVRSEHCLEVSESLLEPTLRRASRA